MNHKNPVPHKGGPSPTEKLAHRERACDQIHALLAEKPRTVAEIADALKVKEGMAHRYLAYLAEMGEACRQAERGPNNRQIWQAGRDGVAKDEHRPSTAFSGVKVVPARQVGMWRHWMDVALFGPAPGAAS